MCKTIRRFSLSKNPVSFCSWKQDHMKILLWKAHLVQYRCPVSYPIMFHLINWHFSTFNTYCKKKYRPMVSSVGFKAGDTWIYRIPCYYPVWFMNELFTACCTPLLHCVPCCGPDHEDRACVKQQCLDQVGLAGAGVVRGGNASFFWYHLSVDLKKEKLNIFNHFHRLTSKKSVHQFSFFLPTMRTPNSLLENLRYPVIFTGKYY